MTRRAYRETLAVLALSAVTLAGIVAAGETGRTAPAPWQLVTSDTRGGYPACVSEDSRGCVWDGRHAGNGVGRSFLATRDGRVIYLPHRAAHALIVDGGAS